MGERYAIDFVGVDSRGRTAERVDWHSVFGTESPESFVGFGRPILAPVGGIVIGRHDGEPDHEARRSPVTLVPYLLSQQSRVRDGLTAIAGNYVIIALPDRGAFVGLVHLRRDSVRVAVGDTVVTGQHIADCGNSGNSTQPHLHLQAMDSDDLSVAGGIPICFRRFRQQRSGRRRFQVRDFGVPAEGAVVEAG